MTVASDKGYRVICISFYDDDLAELDATVSELRAQGFTRPSRSAVLRAAMRLVTAKQIAEASRGEMGREPKSAGEQR